MKRLEETDILKYFASNNYDETWGIKTTTAGFESIKSRDDDPILAMHPSNYRFKSEQGKILNEFQLIYITKGRGVFKSASSGTSQINAGKMFLLFPGERLGLVKKYNEAEIAINGIKTAANCR